MARFKIYSKDGQTVRYEGCPKYNGTYLKVSYLEFSSIASPTPIAWQVGDYVDYPRTGLRYTLRSIPAVKKTAKPGQTGDAFVYQNVQFMAQTQDLAVAPFVDLVPEDNGVHFSTQSAVSTFENAYGIAARIQACLDDLFPGVWDVQVYENLDEDFAKKISEAADFSIDGGTCLEACDRMYDTWGIGWTHYKDSASGKDVLLFGRPNTRTSDNTSPDFVFGPGSGLTALKKSVANSDEIGTRLRVFGSSRNIPTSYYRGLDVYNGEGVDIQNLMIPLSKWGKTDGKPDARKAYLQASDDVVAALGLIPRTHYFDGSDGEEIYPSLEGVTVGAVRAAKQELQDTTYVPSQTVYPDASERVDEIESATNPEDDGYSGGSDGSKYKDTQVVSYAGVNRQQVHVSSNVRPEQYGDPTVINYFILNQISLIKDDAVTVESGMEGYIEDANGIIYSDAGSVKVVLTLRSGTSANGNLASKAVETTKEGNRYNFRLPEITLEHPSDYTNINLELTITVKASRSANSFFYVNLSGHDFLLGEYTPIKGDFTLTLKQIGFDISQRASLTADGLARIYMVDGMNAGRSFYVRSCSYTSDSDTWLLGMYRTEDESTGMRYPNSQFPINPGDHFLLLDIAMPELYVGIASQKLYDKGLEMLDGISRVKPYYEPEVDAIVMTEQARVLREGMYMRLTDADIAGDSSEYVLIDTLTINEGEAEIPTYKVGLREYKKKTFQETTKAAIDSISQKVSEGAAGKPTVSGATYGSLKDKPSIDGVTLAGAMRSYDDIGLLNKTHFEVVNVGTEESPILALRTKYGIVSESFISARGSDPEAGGGASGVDMDTVWAALAAGTSELINVSHIPELSISKITGLQAALDSKLESITKPMVEAVLTGTITSHNHDGRYAPLSGGLIPSQYLPSYVDDVLEYASLEDFPATGETEKIYVALDTNLTYRWGGSSYVEISPSLTLGHTSSTAYPGDEGAANASAIRALQGYFTNGAANRVAHELTISYSGGDSETYDGSSAVTVTMPTEAQMTLWDRICALFGIDDDGHVYVKGGKGFYGTSFVSSRGSDPEAGTSGGGGLDEDALWDILTSPGTEKIDASHLPAITASMIEGLASASVAYAATSGTAGKVAHALTVKHDGGSSSAADKTFDGSAAVTVTIPTTLPASDVYAWAKAASKPSYTWGEIDGKPSVFTPAAHTHPLSGISDLHASWDALLKAAPSAYVTRWPAWGEVTGKPSSFTPAEHTHVKADITDFPTSWAWSAITGKPSTLAGYGITDGVNSVTASGGLSASVSGHKLTVGVASGHAVPTSAQISAWNLVASLFGVDSDGNVYVKGGKGFYGTSFVSSRGSDPEAGQGGGTGVDMDAVWDALAAGTSEQINASHIPALNIPKITGLQSALDGKLNNASTAYDTAYARGFQINGTTYTLWAITNPGTIGPFFAPSSAGTSGYILQSTGGVPAWIGRSELTQQLFSGYKGCESIPENSDLNDYTTPGLYFCPANVTVQTLANVPVTGAFSLEILQTAGVIQILREYGYSSNANEYTRRYYNYNGSWTTWVRAPRLNELYTKTEADGRYLKLTGGTMTGKIVFSGATNATSSIKMSTDTSNYRVGVQWESKNEGTKLGEIGYWNARQRIYLNALADEVTEVWTDTVGKYSLVVGKNLLTYNTHPLLHSANYTNYTVTKTGGGASGTWGINISGNAASATNATYAQRANYLFGEYTGSGGTQPPSYFKNKGLKVNMMGEPLVYSDVIVVNGYNVGADVPYINAIGFQKTANDHGEVYHARGDYGGDSWGTWYKFLDEYNYAGVLDSHYVKKSGDTMTGALTISTSGCPLYIQGGSSAESYLKVRLGGTDKSAFGYNSSLGTFLYSYTYGGYLSLSDSGLARIYKGRSLVGTLWHSGNDGSGSGLDADLLDGTQKSGLLTSVASTAATNLSVTVGGTVKSVADLYATYLDGHPATSFDLSTNLGGCPDYGCYVIGLMQITDYTTAGNHAYGELILIRQNGNNPVQKIIYALSTRYNTTDVRFGHLVVGYYSTYATPCTFTHNGKKWAGFNVTVASSYYTGVVCKRDGLRLGERSTPFLLMYKNSKTGEVLDSEVNGSLSVDGGDITNDGVSTTRFVGALKGNATTATKLATARTLWGQSFDGSGNISGDMTGVGLINGALHIAEQGDDLVKLRTRNHYLEFSGYGYMHKSYYFRPGYSSAGTTNASVYIQNASASDNPTFTTTHAFDANGNATHSGALSAGSSITSGGHLLMKAATGRFIFNSNGSGFMMSMKSGNFRLMSHNTGSYVARLVEVDMSGNVGIKAAPASGYALNVAGAGYFSSLLLANAGIQIGATSDIGWYLNNSRITAGTQVARGVNVGNLLVSNVRADYRKVPANGIYAKGAVLTDGYLQVGSGRLRWDAANNALYVEKSDGTACGFYSKGYLSARGSDPEAGSGGSSELVPVVTLSKLTVGTNVSIRVLASAGLTNDVLEKMRDGAVGRIKAVFSDGSTEIWPVLHASEGFISFGYDTVAGGYMDTMNIYEITIPSKTSVIRVEHFER